MRLIVTIILISFLQSKSIAQKITYNIPEGYEKDISAEDYKTLVDQAVSIIKTRFKIDYVRDGEVHLVQQKNQTVSICNLHNVITKCIGVNSQIQRDEIIKTHFENFFTSLDEQKSIDPTNFESVKKYLSLRIYPDETISRFGKLENLVYRSDLEGTYTTLMLDLPGTFTTVSNETFNLWKKERTEVFRIAQENINKQIVEKLTQKFDFDNISIEIFLVGNEDYAASYSLDLGNNSPELVGQWGSAIAIPNKGIAILCKISKEKPVDFVKFIQATKTINEKYFDEHPQRISNQYFWYYNGKFTKISVVEDSRGTINVICPLGLADLMSKK